MEVYTNYQNTDVCSNLILGERVFNYFDYFIHRMIIGTPVKEWHNNLYIFKQIQSVFLSVIFTVGVFFHRGASTSISENEGEVLGHITFSSLQFKNTLPPIKNRVSLKTCLGAY